MSIPNFSEYVIIGAGIHGLSTAWRLAKKFNEIGEDIEGRIVVLEKSGIAERLLETMAILFGKIKGGNSDMISLFKNLRKITPVRANPVIANNEYQKYSIKISKDIPVVVTA